MVVTRTRKTNTDSPTELLALIRFSSYLLDQLNEGILIADHNCIVRYVNSRYTKITGVKFNEIVGRPLLEVRPNALLPEVLKKNQPIEGVHRKEGAVEYVVNINPLIINSKIIGGLSIVIDMTTVRKMSRDLDKSISKLKKIESSIRSIFPARYTFKDILGKSSKIKSAIDIAVKAAHSNANVLIRGESGTGKEMFAHAIHEESDRRGKPFIPVNCAAIPPWLLESELFGYSEGAFTGAKKGGKIGLLELGNHGTILLDEIGDMDADQQAKILRVLEDQRFVTVGGIAEKEIDIRIISSSNKNLESLMSKKIFREDLYYRLNAVRINVPPLKERVEDIPIIVNSFLDKYSIEGNKKISISDKAMDILQRYSWPGNVRELKHIIEYCVLISDTLITHNHLPANLVHESSETIQDSFEIKQLKDSMRVHEKQLIQQAMQRFGNDLEGKKKASKALGISLSSLYQKLNF
jgi:PAS domain S-box-containing protein